MKTKEFDMRCIVTRQLFAEGFKREHIRHELTLDTSSSGGRSDIVLLLDNIIAGIEIKSASDTTKLIPEQRRAMGRAFDRRCVIMDAALREKSGARYDLLWCNEAQQWVTGLSGGLVPHHSAKPICHEIFPRWHKNNFVGYATSHVDMLSLLWRNEAVELAARSGGPRGGTRYDAIIWMKENLTLKIVRAGVTQALRARVHSKWEQKFWAAFDAGEGK